MPTASGHDRNNISTTFNFSRSPTLKRRTSESTTRPVIIQDPQIHTQTPRQQNSLQKRYSIRTTERIERQESPEANYSSVQDPKLREIINKLVKAEDERNLRNIDPSLVTQIDHQGYSLFFSKTGLNPFELRPPQKCKKINSPRQMVNCLT